MSAAKSIAGVVLRLVGTGLVAWALFKSPLVQMPGIDTIYYAKSPIGGLKLSWVIVIALLLGTILGAFRVPKLPAGGWFAGGLGFGLLFGTIKAIYSWAADMLTFMGKDEALLEQAVLGIGFHLIIAGATLWVLAALIDLFTPAQRKRRLFS